MFHMMCSCQRLSRSTSCGARPWPGPSLFRTSPATSATCPTSPNRGRVEYALEYGTDALEMHTDAVTGEDRVLIVDDVLATGGTAAAAARLVRTRGGEVVGFTFLIELDFLKGRARLQGERIEALLHYT